MNRHSFLPVLNNHFPLYEGTYKGKKSYINLYRRAKHKGDSIVIADHLVLNITGKSREELLPIFKEIRQELQEAHPDYVFKEGKRTNEIGVRKARCTVEDTPNYAYSLTKGDFYIQSSMGAATLKRDTLELYDGMNICVVFHAKATRLTADTGYQPAVPDSIAQ